MKRIYTRNEVNEYYLEDILDMDAETYVIKENGRTIQVASNKEDIKDIVLKKVVEYANFDEEDNTLIIDYCTHCQD